MTFVLRSLHRTCTRLAVAALALGLVAETHTSHAADAILVPEGCGSAALFRDQIRERLREESDVLLENVRLSILRDREGYRLTVRVLDRTRTLTDENCQDLFRAGVVVALLLAAAPREAEPEATRTTSTEPRASVAEGPPSRLAQAAPPSTKPEVAHQPTAAQVASWRWRGSLGAHVGVSTGLLPSPAIAIGPEGALEYGPFGLALELRYLPSSDHRDEQAKGVRVSAFGASGSARARLLPWLATELGGFAYRVHGEGLGARSNGVATVVAAGPQTGLWVQALELDHLELRAGVEAQLALLRPRFEVLEYKEVFYASRLFWRGYLAADYRF